MEGKGGLIGWPLGHCGGGPGGRPGGRGEDGGNPGGGGGLGTMGWLIAVMWWNAVIVSPSLQHRKNLPSGIWNVPCLFSSSQSDRRGVMGPTAHTSLVRGSQ